jgi:Family of unknown function (DUF6272)
LLAQSFHATQQTLLSQGIILSYTGYVSEGVLYSLGEALKQKLTLDHTDKNVSKRLFSVFVEQVQNMIRYSADRQEGGEPPVELSVGMIVVGKLNDELFVVCGNVIETKSQARLSERLTMLSKMDKEELKHHYRERLKQEPEEHSKGASIGLIEIARRSSRTIEFDFHPLSPESSFFCLKAYI